MFKKISCIGALFVISLSTAFAGIFYAVPTLTYQSFFNSGDVRYQAITGRLALGYGNLLNEWAYFAGEVFANPNSIRLNNKPLTNAAGQTIDDQSLITKYSYGFSLLPGIILDGMTRGYVRLGVIYTHFSQLDLTKRGYQIGAGLDFELTPCWMIRAEYDYNKYGSVEQISSVRADEFNLGVIYTFNSLFGR